MRGMRSKVEVDTGVVEDMYKGQNEITDYKFSEVLRIRRFQTHHMKYQQK